MIPGLKTTECRSDTTVFMRLKRPRIVVNSVLHCPPGNSSSRVLLREERFKHPHHPVQLVPALECELIHPLLGNENPNPNFGHAHVPDFGISSVHTTTSHHLTQGLLMGSPKRYPTKPQKSGSKTFSSEVPSSDRAPPLCLSLPAVVKERVVFVCVRRLPLQYPSQIRIFLGQSTF